mgnify:CR=1 FL=1
MGKMDQGFKDLLAEVVQLIGKAVNERMKSKEFRESDASDIFKQVERFYRWAFEYLNKNGK